MKSCFRREIANARQVTVYTWRRLRRRAKNVDDLVAEPRCPRSRATYCFRGVMIRSQENDHGGEAAFVKVDLDVLEILEPVDVDPIEAHQAT
jgi:hypothetical protein